MMPWRLVLGIFLACVVGCGEDVFELDEVEEDDGDDDSEPEPCSGEYGKTWYVSPEGAGWGWCTGLSPDPYVEGGAPFQSCAFSHPFHVLPPGHDALMDPGDRLIIAAGDYAMGAGALEGLHPELCGPDFGWDCAAASIPSGEDEEEPTCILGEGWDGECEEQAVVLSAVGGASHVLSLEGSSNVRVECLEITDGSECIWDHPDLTCSTWPEPAEPEGGLDGIYSAEAEHVTLRSLWIHGMPRDGIRAQEWSANWTLEDVVVTHNGWNGISFPSDGEPAWGEMRLVRVNASWNGCGEWWELPEYPVGCWNPEGDELGIGYGIESWFSAANWWIEDCDLSHNTSSGALIWAFEPEHGISIDRLRAEGNAGPQLDLGGDTAITNSLLISNCEFHAYNDYELSAVEPCNLGGTALSFYAFDGADLSLVNSTLFGQGAAMLDLYGYEEPDCLGSEVLALNNVFVGREGMYGIPSMVHDHELSCIGWIDAHHSVIHEISDAEEYWAFDDTNLNEDPGFEIFDLGDDDLFHSFRPELGSPPIDHGMLEDDDGLIPDHDFEDNPRPMGPGVDCGAYEIEQ
jgi:hypothetical protein